MHPRSCETLFIHISPYGENRQNSARRGYITAHKKQMHPSLVVRPWSKVCPLNKTDYLWNYLTHLIKLLWNSVNSNSISNCPALQSNVAALNLCTSFVASTSSRDQAVVYMCVRLYWHYIAIVFFLLFFVPLLFLLICTTICGEHRFSMANRCHEKNA